MSEVLDQLSDHRQGQVNWNARPLPRISNPLGRGFCTLRHFDLDDTILAMCRSGGRSAWAVNMLAKAGFKKVYTIVDGMEGDKVKEAGSVFQGKRMKNGWKNTGLPWTYDLNPELIWHPNEDKLEEVQNTLDL